MTFFWCSNCGAPYQSEFALKQHQWLEQSKRKLKQRKDSQKKRAA